MSVSLGTLTTTGNIERATERKIVKASNGTLLLFANDGGNLVYKKSTDDGDNWDAGWTTVYSGYTNMYSFDVMIHTNDDISIAHDGFSGNTRWFYQRLTYISGTTWTTETEVLGNSAVSVNTIKLSERANGDLWVAYNPGYTIRVSTDNGASWAGNITSPIGSSEVIWSMIPHGNDMWYFMFKNGYYGYYVYTTGWSGLTVVSGSGNTNQKDGTCVLKIADDNIWVATSTASGIKVNNWNGATWSDEVITNNAGDDWGALSNVDGNPCLVWRDDTGGQEDISYRLYNGSSWDAQVDVTDSAEGDSWLSCADNDSGSLYFTWLAGDSDPRTVTFDKVAIVNAMETITIEESLGLEDDVTLNIPIENISIEELLGLYEETRLAKEIIPSETLGLSDTVELNIPVENITINESLGLGDIARLPFTRTIELAESLGITEEIVIGISETVNASSRIISFNPLLIITDTNPAVLIEVNIDTPSTPQWTTYDLNVSGETVRNATDITYNTTNGFIYITCATGQLMKVDATDFYARTQIDLGTTNGLTHAENLATGLITYSSTDKSTGQIMVLDESEIDSVNLDIRYAMQHTDKIPLQINTVLASVLDLDIRVLAVETASIGVDIRFLKYDYSVVSDSPIDYTDWIVKINGVDMVPLKDVDMKSIVVNITSATKSSASFLLHREHDKLNYTNAGAGSIITSNNSVAIYIDGNLVFNGKVSNIDTASETESVIVTAQADIPTTKKNSISLPLPSVNEQLNLYHCLVDNVSIDNPYIATDEENPEYYKGIKYDKGIMTKQKVSRYSTMYSVLSEINAGTFSPKQNWSYFWKASIKYLASSSSFGSTSTTNSRYIGPSLSPISSDVIELVSVGHYHQRIYDDIVSNLGYGYIGSAPYLEISGPNGVLQVTTRWEDKADGLYNVDDPSFDNRNLLYHIAQLEYEKLQNINGGILPITSTEIHLSLNGYFYYDVNLLSRINLTNTTTANIYNGINGFPVAVKGIRLSSSDMKAVLTCDNQKSQEELDEIDARYPSDDSGQRDGVTRKQYSKWDILSRSYVS